jgi:hypothetical protein
MAAYGSIDTMKAGLIYGLSYEAETKVVPSGKTFEFGEPVFVTTGDANSAYYPLSSDASLKFLGVAPISQRSSVDDEGAYEAYDDMNVVTEGIVTVNVHSGIASSSIANTLAYIQNVAASGQYKKFYNATGNSYATAVGYFRSNAVGGLALLELTAGLK